MRVVVLAFALSVLAGYGFAFGKHPSRDGETLRTPKPVTQLTGVGTAVQPVPQPDTSQCGAGSHDPEPVQPTLTLHAGRRALSLRLHNGQHDGARFKYGVEIIDDREHAILPATLSPVATYAAGADADAPEIALPTLPDGYYFVRVVLASVSDSRKEKSSSDVVYLRVLKGKVEQISVNQYTLESKANMAVREEEDAP